MIPKEKAKELVKKFEDENLRFGISRRNIKCAKNRRGLAG
jgi:hypothetical protein